jgi:hypothetical protein
MQATEERERQENPHMFNRNALRSGMRIVRVGTSGGWREQLSSDQQARFGAFSLGLERMGYPPAG